MHLSHRVTAVVAAAPLLAGVLGGCSMGGDDSGSSSRGNGSGSSSGDADVAAGKASFDNAAKPVVEGTFDSAAAAGTKVDIAIMGLRAKGRLATLNVRFTPRVPAGGPGSPNPYTLNGQRSLDTSLIDPVNLKRYVVVSDSGGKKLETDDIFTNLTNNQPAPLYYTFAAPPENVKSVDVQIGSWPTFRGIPVER
ncbi:hypothetical protein OHR68_28385 [Spirillospora sp. NBC_00431]